MKSDISTDTGETLFQDYLSALSDYRKKLIGLPKSLSGAVAAEMLRRLLRQHEIPVSERNVFVLGLPIEFDLVVLVPGARPISGVPFPQIAKIYNPKDIVVAIEVKGKGNWENQLDGLKRNRDQIKQLSEDIEYIYVALGQRKTYRGKATQETLGFPAFNLVWYRGDGNSPRGSGEWLKLLALLKKHLRARTRKAKANRLNKRLRGGGLPAAQRTPEPSR